jgi:hypothetical protein
LQCSISHWRWQPPRPRRLSWRWLLSRQRLSSSEDCGPFPWGLPIMSSIPDDRILVTKLDAVRRQLNTAIRLWFEDADPVSIHTLASAAHDILHQLFKKRGLTGLLFDADIVVPEYRREWSEAITKHYNFFKHGRKDADKTIEFRPGVNEFLLLFQIRALRQMGETLTFFEQAFMQWYFINRPEFLIEGAIRATTSRLSHKSELSQSKSSFITPTRLGTTLTLSSLVMHNTDTGAPAATLAATSPAMTTRADQQLTR